MKRASTDMARALWRMPQNGPLSLPIRKTRTGLAH
jgi:hypothetical protein